MPGRNVRRNRNNVARGAPRRRRGGRSRATVMGQAVGTNLSRPARQNNLTVTKWGAPVVIVQSQFDSFGAFQFELADTEASAVAAFWQQYQLVKIEASFRPMFRANPVIDDTVCAIPLIMVASDPNDISSWTVMTQAESHTNLVVRDDDAGFVVTFKPSVATALYAGAFTAFGHYDSAPWVDTATPTVRYYGLKWGITGSGFAASHYQSWRVMFRHTVRLRYAK